MKRIIACPASVGLSRRVPVPPASIFAAAGTVAHALAEDILLFGSEPQDAIGELVEQENHVVPITPAFAAAVRTYTDEVARCVAGADWHAFETRVCLDPYWGKNPPPVSAFGTADTLAYRARTRHLDVLDYKHGSGVFVEVEDNPQLLYYAAGALLVVPGLVDTVTLTVVQPRVAGEEKVRSWSTSTVDVLMWVDDVLKPAIAAAFDPFAGFAAGKHCQFCPVAANKSCPALARLAQDRARADFAAVPVY